MKTKQKSTKGTASTSTPKRKRKINKKKLDNKNVKNTVKQTVKSQRDIKYKYPNEMDNTLDRKAWRQKARNKNNKFLAKIAKLEKAKDPGLAKSQADYKKFRKTTYTVA